MIREFAGEIERNVVTRQAVTVEQVEEKMPTPDSLLAAALSEPSRPTYLNAGDYADTVHELRGRGFTWLEVVAWMAARGVVFSQQGLQSGYRNRYGPGERR